MSELKCCPFCGGEAELMIFNSEYGTVTVGCTNEDCDITMGKAFFTDEEAIRHWNRRKPMTNIVEKLEREKSKSIYDSDSVIDVKGAYTKAINIVKQEINNGLE
jgi:hypothetical protein